MSNYSVGIDYGFDGSEPDYRLMLAGKFDIFWELNV